MNEFKMNELYHHGILGQKWGIRRYQNKDGSLTAAGLRREQRERTKEKVSEIKANAKAEAKRISAQGKADAKIAKAYAKAQAKKDEETAKANALINRNIEKVKNKSVAKQEKERLKEQEKKTKEEEKKEKVSDSKSIKDMTNDEIQAKITRIRLENQLKELTPEKKSRVRSFISKFVGDAAEPAVIEGSKRAFTNLTQAWWQDKFGIDINKDGKLVGFKKDKNSNNSDDDRDGSNSNNSNKNKKQNKTNKTDDGSNTNNTEDSSNSDKSNDDGSNKSGTSNTNNSSKNSNQNKSSEPNPFTKDNAIGLATVVGKELAPEIRSITNTVKDAYKKSMSTDTAYDLVKESANKPVSALINRNEASSTIYDDAMNSIRSEHASTRLSVTNYEATSNYKSSGNLNQFMNDNSGLSVKELMQRNNYNKYYDKTVKHSEEDGDDVLNGEQE